MAGNRLPWPPEWEAALYELKAQGVGPKAIAVELSRRFERDINPGMVSKKIARDRLRTMKSDVTKAPEGRVLPVLPAAGEHQTPQNDSPAALTGKAIMELGQWECHYPISSNNRNHRFCAEPVVGAKPYRYCWKHAMLCYST